MTKSSTVQRAVAFFLISLALTSLGVWVASEKFDRPAPGIDDAYIYFVYGQNIADGEGLVYNPGGERVEGFTSALWMLVVAVAFLFSDQPDTLILLLDIFLISGAVAYLWHFISRGKLVSWRSIIFLAWVFASPGFVVWMTLPLMDITLWSALLIVAAITVIEARSSLRLGVLIALVVLARPEGILWGLVLLFLFGIGVIAKEGLGVFPRKIRLPMLAYAVTLTTLVAVRLLYFGYPLPNTYYAKVGPDLLYNLVQGGLYLVNFIASYRFAIILVLGASVAGIVFNLPKFLRRLKTAPFQAEDDIHAEYLVVSLLAVVGLVVPVLAGGDHFSMYRFYQPIWPLLILPILAMLETIRRPVPSLLRYGVLLGALAVLIWTPWYRWENLSNSWLRVEFLVAQSGFALGDNLNSLFAEDPPSVGYGGAGTFAFIYEGNVVDIYGLNNVAMGHSPGNRRGIKNHSAFDTDVLLAQQPDIFFPKICSSDQFTNASGPIPYKDDAALDGIFEDRRFLNLYTLSSVIDSENCVLAWFKRSYFEELNELGYSPEELDYRLVNTSSEGS